MGSTKGRIAAATALAVGALVVLATPVSAHITVNPGEAEAGGYTKLAFRVPNERSDAGTTSVQVVLPEEHPIANVSVRPTPGWTYSVENLVPEGGGDEDEEPVVTSITWEGGEIEPGEFQEFELSVGPLPDDVDELVFRAVQTYSSGEVVRWIDVPEAEGDEVEHPAPVLTLVEGDGDHGGGGDADDPVVDDADGVEDADVAAPAIDDSDGSDETGLAIAGVLLGVIGIGVGGFALLRSRGSA